MASIADQFLQYGQLRAQQSQNLGNSIGDTIDLVMKMRAQREADLEAARQKEAERMAAQQAKQQEVMLDPEKAIMQIQTKAATGAPLTPQEEAVLQTAKGVLGAKVVYDQFGQPRAGYDLTKLGAPSGMGAPAGIAATPLMPTSPQIREEALPPPTLGGQGMLMPPAAAGSNPSRADFDKFMAGGKLPTNINATAPTASTQIAQTAEQRLSEMGITKPVKPERLDFATAKQYEADLASYNKSLEEQRKSVFDTRKQKVNDTKSFKGLTMEITNLNDKIDTAVNQSARYNVGAMAGEGGKLPFGLGHLTGGIDLAQTLETVKSDAALGRLAEMKAMSETGASGLGATNMQEFAKLESARQSLEQSQSESQLDSNLKKYKQIRNEVLKNTADAYNRQYGEYPEGYDPKMFVDVSGIPQGAIQKLRTNPSLRDAFDAKYGAGAANKALGK